MIITIHQPEFIPWIGFFDRIVRADIFVVLDHVQYQKNGFINRNRIKNNTSWNWITIPINQKMHHKPIQTVEIQNGLKWQEKQFKSILLNYSKARFFKKYYSFLEKIYKREWQTIADLDWHVITELIKIMGIRSKIYKSSTLDIKGESNDMIINICKRFGADTYLSGIGAKNYMDLKKFENSDIEIKFQKYIHPVYRQLHPKSGFIPNLSIIDLLLNNGDESLEIIKSGGE